VNSISPGIILTPLARDEMSGPGHRDDLLIDGDAIAALRADRLQVQPG
jgi:hypothetical protein